MGASDSKVPADPDTVLLHGGFPRGSRAPSLSPFVMKAETYLRMNKIEYKFTDKGGMGPKGKVPWIEYKGETVSDSYFLIKHLNKKMNIDMDKNLSDVEKATSTAFRVMLDEFLVYATSLELLIWNDTDSVKKFVDFPTPMIWMFKARGTSRMKSQGIGLHTQEEIRGLFEEQISAVSAQLGDKPYMFGEEPTEFDCSAFGIMCSMKYIMEKNMHPRKLIEEKYKNLNEYMDRIKTNFYPDWDELLVPVGADKNKNSTTK